MNLRKFNLPNAQPKKLNKKQINTFNAYSHFYKQGD